MDRPSPRTCVAYLGTRLVGSGPLEAAVVAAKQALDAEPSAPVLIFDAETSEPVEIDFRGTEADVVRATRMAISLEGPPPEGEADRPRGPGRPKLGVVPREVTLLPRHWEWLGHQPGGASAVLRRLVDEARRSHAGKERTRAARESAYRFMVAMAGNEPGFEEALRGLFAGDLARVEACTASWPPDVRDHTRRLARASATGQDHQDHGDAASGEEEEVRA